MPPTDAIDEVQVYDPTAPTGPPSIGGWPTWLRRTIITIALVTAGAVAIWGAQHTASSTDDNKLNTTVLRLFPQNEAQALRQTEVGADLAPGYDGRLTIDGIAIPEAEMTGAIDPATVTPAQLRKYGLRPNNRNRVYFKPGTGKVIESFRHGTITITLRYFRESRPEQANTVTWTIRVD